MRKNSGLAAVLSFFICGLGQIYNGEIVKGLLMTFGIGLLGYLGLTQHFLFWVISFALWIFGIFNAYSAAEEINEQIIRFEVQKKQEQENKNQSSSTASIRVPPGGFKRKIKGKIEHQNFKPID